MLLTDGTVASPHSLFVRLHEGQYRGLRLNHHLSQPTGRDAIKQMATVKAHCDQIHRAKAGARDPIGNSTRSSVVEKFHLCSGRGDLVFELAHHFAPFTSFSQRSPQLYPMDGSLRYSSGDSRA